MVIKIAEKFNRLSRVHQRYRQTTDRRQTERRWHIANVTYAFTFANKLASYGTDGQLLLTANFEVK